MRDKIRTFDEFTKYLKKFKDKMKNSNKRDLINSKGCSREPLVPYVLSRIIPSTFHDNL